jgi:hypothetical protein
MIYQKPFFYLCFCLFIYHSSSLFIKKLVVCLLFFFLIYLFIYLSLVITGQREERRVWADREGARVDSADGICAELSLGQRGDRNHEHATDSLHVRLSQILTAASV